ncbi:MAG: IclR family transcriptional regulator [Deltaproteobacteria bacterium]|jgi:DNA-binding IclR family transcriptional regulator|nr:IclR family transcriptional regulator [Deltaproteobacteria bacterium]
MLETRETASPGSGGIKVLDRVLDIIDVLARSGIPLGLSEIARSVGLSKSTAHRLLSALRARHYVEKRPDNTYRVGIKMLEMASFHINTLELLTEARPCLNALHSSLNLTSHLGILEDYQVVYIGLMDAYPSAKLYAQVGKRSPAFCSSMGKCLLANLGRDDLDEALRRINLVAYTAKTIVDPQELRRHLVRVRGRGWAVDNGEYQPGQRCVGAPVFDYRGDSLAAISVSGSVAQITDGRIEGIAAEVRSTAQAISRSMGYSG